MAFQLNKVFSNGMVFQRYSPIRIFGHGSDGEVVYALFNGVLKNAEIKEGKFMIEFDAMGETIGLSLMCYSNDKMVILNDICIGEVFLGAGQSNMEFLLKYDKSFNKNEVFPDDPYIRYFDVFKKTYKERDTIKELKNEYNCRRKADNINDLQHFSAVSYYFLKKIKEILKVPVAVIGCNYGGSSASSWIPESEIRKHKNLKVYLDEYESINKELDLEAYKKSFIDKDKWSLKNKKLIEINEKIALGTISEKEVFEKFNLLNEKEKKYFLLPKGPYDPTSPGVLYENMLKEIIPFSLRGVIYYQGESDENHHDKYFELMKVLINYWRESFHQNLPFITTMLAPFKEWLGNKGNNFPYIREAQYNLSKKLNDVYVANIMDDGDEFDIHPKNKKIVGERLGLIALEKIFFETIDSYGPQLDKVFYKNNELIITFTNVGNGLKIIGNEINDLYINKEDINKYKFILNKDSISIFNKFEDETINIEYLFKDFTKANLYSSNGLPAFPFRVTVKTNNLE